MTFGPSPRVEGVAGRGVRDSGPGPQASTGYWLRNAALAWQRELGRRLRPLNLTPTQFMVLSSAGWLTVTSGAPTQQGVADLAGSDRMMTSKVAATLEKLGLLERFGDAHHGKLRRLRQTARGRELTLAALGHLRDIEETFFSDLDTVALRRQLAALSDRIPLGLRGDHRGDNFNDSP